MADSQLGFRRRRKIATLPGTHAESKLVLARTQEKVDRIANVIVLVEWDDGTWDIDFSDISYGGMSYAALMFQGEVTKMIYDDEKEKSDG